MSNLAQAATEEMNNQYLTFLMGKELYGIDLLRVKEIIEYAPLTPVPMVPDYIAGVINLRGSVMPVIDISVRFGSTKTDITKRSCIIIVEVKNGDERLEMGVQVDEVNEVVEIMADQVEAPPAFGTRIRTDFIAGMGKVDDKFVILLNSDHVLSVEELTVVDGAAHLAEEAHAEEFVEE